MLALPICRNALLLSAALLSGCSHRAPAVTDSSKATAALTGDEVDTASPNASINATTVTSADSARPDLIAPSGAEVPCEDRDEARDTVALPEYAPIEEFFGLLTTGSDSLRPDSVGIRRDADKLLALVSDSGLDRVDINGPPLAVTSVADTLEHFSRAQLRAELRAGKGKPYKAMTALATDYAAWRQAEGRIGYCTFGGAVTAFVSRNFWALTWRQEKGRLRLTRIAFRDWQQE